MANLHLSYEEFKNFYGDLGITYWTKYNYLDLDYVGKYNFWDEEWKVGTYNNSTGEFITNGEQRVCNKNPIRLYANKRYYMPSVTYYLYCYDNNMSFLGLATYVRAPDAIGWIFTLLDNTYYVNFSLVAAYGPVYNYDVRMYQPVMDLARDSLADFAYSYDSALERFYSSNLVGVVKVPSANTVKANIYCRLYKTNDYSSMTLYDDVIAVSTSGIIWIKDTTYNTVLSFKEGMKNESVYIVYEKA